MPFTRREICTLLPVLALTGPGYSAAPSDAKRTKLESKAYVFENLPKQTNGDHISTRILDGDTDLGVPLEVHETELPPGGQPHPPHHHLAAEMFLIREGTLQVEIDGKYTIVTPGSVAFIASNVEHGIRNHGKDWARYFVVTLG